VHDLVSQERIDGGFPAWHRDLGPGHGLGGIHDPDPLATLASPHRYDYRLEWEGVARPRPGRPFPEGTRWLAPIVHRPRPQLNYTRFPAPAPPSRVQRVCRAITRWLGWDRDLLGAQHERS
jgi:hypothetical protein